MIPLWSVIASGFTSGTINVERFRPSAKNHFRQRPRIPLRPPKTRILRKLHPGVLAMTKSIFLKTDGSSNSTLIVSPLKRTSFPADRSEASSRQFLVGKIATGKLLQNDAANGSGGADQGNGFEHRKKRVMGVRGLSSIAPRSKRVVMD